MSPTYPGVNVYELEVAPEIVVVCPIPDFHWYVSPPVLPFWIMASTLRVLDWLYADVLYPKGWSVIVTIPTVIAGETLVIPTLEYVSPLGE